MSSRHDDAESRSLVHDDSDSVFDWLLLALTIALTIPFLIANGVVFLHRKRKYFQVTGWELILGSSAAAVIWIGATLIVNQHFKRDNLEFFSYCSLWTFWFQLTFGVCLWLCFMALRLHHLFTVCNTGKPPSSIRVWAVYIPVLLAPATIFAIVATVLRVCRHPCPEMQDKCVISSGGWKLGTFLSLPTLYFSMIVILLIRLRNQSDYLLQTQCQHSKDYAVMAFVIYLLTGTTYWSNRQNQLEGRSFLTFSVCSIVFIHFWVHTGWPVYLCLFKKADEMDKYEESLRRHGATCLQRFPYEPRVDADGSAIPQSFPLEGEEAIFQAIAVEQTKKEELKTKKEQLHRRIIQVRDQIEELKHQKTVDVLPRNSQSLPPVRSLERVLPNAMHMTRHLSLEMSALSCPSATRFLQG